MEGDDLLPPGEDPVIIDDSSIVDEPGNAPAEDGNVQEKNTEGLSDLDSDEDDVQVTIKALPIAPTAYTSSFMKKGPAPPQEKGKFAPEEFEGSMTINGVPAIDFNLEAMDDKPWRKPGADITDYFNFGFTEDTWNAYCDRQKRLRTESGAGTFTVVKSGFGGHFQPSTIVNENSKYNTVSVVKRTTIQSSLPIKTIPTINTTKIDVIGVTSSSRRTEIDLLPPGLGKDAGVPGKVPNLSLPPPGMGTESVSYDSYGGTDYSYYGGYNEPTQSAQWTPQEPWQPPPLGVPPPVRLPPPTMVPPPGVPGDETEAVTPPPPGADERDPMVRGRRSRSPEDELEKKRREYRERAKEREKDRDREKEREREREKEKDRDRDRERDRDRDRDRERDRDKDRERRERKERRRREKSSSRSPSRHKKSKKSKRHSDSD